MKFYYYYILLLLCPSCKNAVEAKHDILNDFDSINRQLKTFELSPGNNLYDSLLARSWNFPETQQFYYTINDFHAFMQHLRTRLYQAAGDSTGLGLPEDKWDDLALTRSFFADKTNGSNVLYGQLESVISAMKGQVKSDSNLQKIKKFETLITGVAGSQKELVRKYFADTPPVAVNTILNSFEHSVRTITLGILQEYFKSK